ncbi:MAG TPA: glycosyltransferase family 2 protein [Acetobacteraceae bacterium]|nr:glycosyltransferase family 2 protein [Acetobacteraceae bacterium]
MTSGCCVSVLVPAYNSAATLRRAVESVLAQDLCDFEILILNDGSSDNTADVAAGCAGLDSRIRAISLPRNRGKPAAMNLGVAEACGRWIAVLDADDWYAPDRLSTLIRAAERRHVHLVADNQFLYDEGAAQVVRTALPDSGGDRPLDKAAFIAGSDPYSDFDFGMLKPIVRTDFIRSTGLTYRENVRLSEDFLYMLEFLAAGGRGWLVSRPLYYWAQAFGTISRRWTETGAGRWRYNFLSAAEANADMMKAMHAAGKTDLAALLQRRVRAFQRLHRLQQVSRLRADGATPARLARELLHHPSIWPLVAHRGLRRAAKAMSFHSLVRA